jgi:hypothetical protein
MTGTLNGSRVNLDLNAARKAAQREATHEAFRFTFGEDDQVFTVPPLDDWPMEVEAALAEGALSKALSVLMGDQMAPFMACHPTFGDIRVLLEQVGSWAGVDNLGNSKPQQPRASLPM